jgi:hypothetical protein
MMFFLVSFRIFFWIFISFLVYIIGEIKKWSKNKE